MGIRKFELYTSSYHRAPLSMKRVNISPAHIKRTQFYDIDCPELAPALALYQELKVGKISPDVFEERYLKAILETYGAAMEVINHLMTFGKTVVLVSPEDRGVYCHRRVLARWLMGETNIGIPEI